MMNTDQPNTTSSLESCLYILIVLAALIAFAIAMLGEWLILAAVVLVGIGTLALGVWASAAMVMWMWRKIAFTRIEIEQKRQDIAIQAATTRQLLLLEDKRSNLVYAHDGFMPLAYDRVLTGDSEKLLSLAAQRIETLRPPENVPSTFHYHVVSDSAQTLNAGTPTGAGVTGNMGDLSVLLTGNQESKYKVIEEGDNEPE